jgi:hypothetical protein
VPPSWGRRRRQSCANTRRLLAKLRPRDADHVGQRQGEAENLRKRIGGLDTRAGRPGPAVVNPPLQEGETGTYFPVL